MTIQTYKKPILKKSAFFLFICCNNKIYLYNLYIMNINNNLIGGIEKPIKHKKTVKYAVLQVLILENADNNLDIKNIFVSKDHIFDREDLADQFCDHANNRETLDYQWIVKKIVIDKKPDNN